MPCNLFEHIGGLEEDNELFYTHIIFNGEKSIKILVLAFPLLLSSVPGIHRLNKNPFHGI